jgi:hypothetical protein
VHWEISGLPDEETDPPDHAVDNGGWNENGQREGYDELVLFEFADPLYRPKSFMTGWNCAWGTDKDSECEFGGSSDIITLIGTGDILGAFLALLQTGDPGAGFTAEFFDDVTIGSVQSFTKGAQGQNLIIAAAPGTHIERIAGQDKVKDGSSAFKITQVVGVLEDRRVSEPALVGLLGLGFVGMAIAARRRVVA